MAAGEIDVDRIVSEVLARLKAAPEPDSCPKDRESDAGSSMRSPRQQEDANADRGPSPEAKGELVFSDRVVTLATLDNRLAGIRRLVVPPGAVVTPSVRDELRRKGIALEYGDSRAKPSVDKVRLAIMVVGSATDPAAFATGFEREEVEVRSGRADCAIAATDRLGAAIRQGGTVGLMATGQPAVALCLANRQPGVRAVLGTDPDSTAAEATSVGANVLVVNPNLIGTLQVRQMVRRFCEPGLRVCPGPLRERLG
ncbi:MAG: hypothetical protein ACYTG0_35540 [Planctomycetota bacterium]|jgi:hypothetical protein